MAFRNSVVTGEEFAALKSTLPNGQLPILEVEEESGEKTVITQSISILRYLGRIGGTYPSENPLMASKVDMALDNQLDALKVIEMTFSGGEMFCVSDKKWTDEEVQGIRKRIGESQCEGSLAYVSHFALIVSCLD